MTSSELPDRASLEYLRKLSKDRLRELRRSDPAARLADAQLAVAREHGFSSWRALKAELDRRRADELRGFFEACAAGDVDALRSLLDRDPALARERDGDGATGLHLAARHAAAVRLLLARGADPNARDVGDHALPIHFAAGGGHLESVRALLDAGSDVNGAGDLHRLEVIGWATVFAEPHRDVVELLVSRGARHHVFSAIALGDVELLRRVVEAEPDAMRRRLSHFEQEQSVLHYVIAPPDGLVGGTFRDGSHYRTLAALIELGAELEARDAKARTPLEVAMLRGDREAMRLLHQAGAREPAPTSKPDDVARKLAGLAGAMGSVTPMIGVPDMSATIDWYRSIGFALAGSHGEPGSLDWARLRFGEADLMLVPSGGAPTGSQARLSLWVQTDRLDELYALLKQRQLERARRALDAVEAGGATEPEVRFTLDLHTAFYGQREFGIRDPNGVELFFFQPLPGRE
jgi:ankyrin repeat protein